MKINDKYYITTAISYPNGRPHMGHAYEVVATDAIARFHRLSGRDVRFLTGTDEHGLKVAQAARTAGIAPLAYVDEMVSSFKELASLLNISHDRFIRTTDPDHIAACQTLWRALAANDDLYLGRYEGWYSVRDEAYYEPAELIDAEDASGAKLKLSPQGTPVEWTIEESWFFRLSKYQDQLLALYDAHPQFVQPASRRNEMRAFVAGGLRDLSISRTSFDWGVPVPDSPGHVMYVWIDALTNYLSGAGYPAENQWWPADLHVVGKDVVRFHAVYWPAFLWSAGLALPTTVFGHGHILNRGEKMSKSLGNVVDPFELAATYGVDQLRWFLLRDVAFGEDGSYSEAAIAERSNADLANGIGNLAQRCLSMISKNCDGRVPVQPVRNADDDQLLGDLVALTTTYMEEMRFLRLHRALEIIMQMVALANGYFADAAPWSLKKTDPRRMASVLYATADAIRRIAILAQPAMPVACAALLDQLNEPTDCRDFSALNSALNMGAQLPEPSGVFPRWVAPDAA